MALKLIINMNKFFLLLIFISVLGFSQQKNKYEKMGLYSTTNVNIGMDLVQLIKDKNKSDYELHNSPPGKFNYGITSVLGYHFFRRFALGTGLRYSFVDSNYHLIYALVQSKFIINNPEEDDPVFLNINFGKQINKTATNNATVIGLELGKTEILNNRFGHQFSLNLDAQIFEQGTLFVGFAYGITIFSNKEYK